jgi:hypothetical protein
MLLNDIMPEYDFTEDCVVKVKATPVAAYCAIKEFTMAEMSPFVPVLAFIRTFPEKLAGRKMNTTNLHAPYLPQECRVFFTELADNPPYEYVAGLIVPKDIGRIWKKTSELDYRPADLTEYNAFDNPAYLKVAMSIAMGKCEDPGCIRLRAEWRIKALSPSAKKRFTPYWRVIGPFSHFIQKSMVMAVKKRAEKTAVEKLFAVI